MSAQKHRLNLIKVTAIASLAGLLFGYDTGVISGAQLYFTDHFNLDAVDQGWAVSSALYGALLGALAAGFLTAQLGRKVTMIIAALLFLVSAWGSGIAESLTELVVYRIIGGIGVGVASMTAPMYIAEVSPPQHRGKMVSIYQLAVVLGFFVVFLASYWIGNNPSGIEDVATYNREQGWRVMFWSEIAPAGLFFLFLFLVPRSPRWLVLEGNVEQAKAILLKFMSPQAAEKEMEAIRQTPPSPGLNLGKIFKQKWLLVILIVGILLSVFQQITGINAILYYGAEIFSNALQYGPEDALKQQLWLAGVNLFFTVVAINQIDKWGRKPLLIAGIFGMLAGLVVLGVSIYLNQLGVVALVSILLYCGAFSVSLGPVVWVLLSEIFPTEFRSVGLSIAVAFQWLFNAFVANSFPVINRSELNADSFNGSLPYWIFATFCVLALFFVWKWVPETKNKRLEEIRELFDKEPKQ